MDKKPIKAHVRKALGADPGFENIWDELCQIEAVWDWETDGDDEKLVASAKGVQAKWRSYAAKIGARALNVPARDEDLGDGGVTLTEYTAPDEDGGVLLTPREELHAAALSACYATLAAAMPPVRYFRHAVLDGTLLTLEQAVAFTRSPAPRLLPQEWFRSCKVPIVAHTAELIDQDRQFDRRHGGLRLSAHVRVTPPGTVEHAEYTGPVKELDMHEFMWPWALPYGVYTGKDVSAPVLPGSPHAHLCDLAAHLSRTYDWGKPAACLFVLTGAPPSITPLKVDVYTRTGTHHVARRLVVASREWVSPQTVEKELRRNRRDLRSKHQPFSARTLVLVRFVEEQRDVEGRRPPWPELLRRWNDAQATSPDCQYKRYEDMARDWGQARRGLLYEGSDRRNARRIPNDPQYDPQWEGRPDALPVRGAAHRPEVGRVTGQASFVVSGVPDPGEVPPNGLVYMLTD